MEIVTGKKEDLEKIISDVFYRIGVSKNVIERYVLVDYLRQLQNLMDAMNGQMQDDKSSECLGSVRKQKAYYNYIDALFSRFDKNFIKYRDFHSDLFADISNIQSNFLSKFVGSGYLSESYDMSEEEFYQYIFEFLKTYGLEKNFDKLINERRIFSRSLLEDGKFYGSCLHDPIRNESSIVLCDFRCELPYLFTVGHELGHTYDLKDFCRKNGARRYLEYSYTSCFGEVLSMTFERLFYDFMFEKNYYRDALNDLFLDYEFTCRENALAMCILTEFSDDVIWNEPDNVPKEELIRQAASAFTEPEEISWLILNRNFDTWQDSVYGYGSFMSTILKENIKNEGLNCLLMKRFLTIRGETFNPKLLEGEDFTVDNYSKIYKKDMLRVKK